jgi:hypothetical protein
MQSVAVISTVKPSEGPRSDSFGIKNRNNKPAKINITAIIIMIMGLSFPGERIDWIFVDDGNCLLEKRGIWIFWPQLSQISWEAFFPQFWQ